MEFRTPLQLLATVLIVSGCASYAVKSGVTPQWGAPHQNLQLGLTLARALTGSPAEMALTLHFRNTGSAPCHLNTSGKVSWSVAPDSPTAQHGGTSCRGSIDYPRHADGAQALDSVPLAPGESVTRQLCIRLPAVTAGLCYRIQAIYENELQAGITTEAQYLTCRDTTFRTDRYADMWLGRLASGALAFTVEP